MSYESTVYQWEEGERRLREAGPRERPILDQVTDRIVAELRRRLGGKFTTEELVALYEAGTDWCLEVAMAAAPASPQAWESSTVCDAAFARYVRGAVDFAGGRRITAG